MNHISSEFRSGPLVDVNVTVLGKKIDLSFPALMDTGASHSLIPLEKVEQLGLCQLMKPSTMTVTVAGGTHDRAIVGSINITLKLIDLQDSEVTISADFMVCVIPIGHEMIIGANVLQTVLTTIPYSTSLIQHRLILQAMPKQQNDLHPQ